MALDNEFDWRKMIDVDNPPFPSITEETREICMRYGVRGDVRLSQGRFVTDEQYEQHRNKSLNTPLP